MKKLFFSSLALGTLAAAGGIQPTAATATEAVFLTENEMDRVARAEPTRLAEAEMDGITAGASLSLTTGASVTGSYATASSMQEENGSSLSGGGAVITGRGVAIGSASGPSTSGTPIAEASASGDKKDTGTFKKVVNVPSRTVVIAATWGYAIDLPAAAKK
jgi:hypothetical protein